MRRLVSDTRDFFCFFCCGHETSFCASTSLVYLQLPSMMGPWHLASLPSSNLLTTWCPLQESPRAVQPPARERSFGIDVDHPDAGIEEDDAPFDGGQPTPPPLRPQMTQYVVTRWCARMGSSTLVVDHAQSKQ